MAGYVEDVQLYPQFWQGDHVVFAHGLGYGANVFLSRPEYRAMVAQGQFGCAAAMVAVVVGEQDGLQAEFVLRQVFLDWIGVAGVNDGGVSAIVDEPDIIVFKGGDGMNGNHFVMVHGDGQLVKLG